MASHENVVENPTRSRYWPWGFYVEKKIGPQTFTGSIVNFIPGKTVAVQLIGDTQFLEWNWNEVRFLRNPNREYAVNSRKYVLLRTPRRTNLLLDKILSLIPDLRGCRIAETRQSSQHIGQAYTGGWFALDSCKQKMNGVDRGTQRSKIEFLPSDFYFMTQAFTEKGIENGANNSEYLARVLARTKKDVQRELDNVSFFCDKEVARRRISDLGLFTFTDHEQEKERQKIIHDYFHKKSRNFRKKLNSLPTWLPPEILVDIWGRERGDFTWEFGNPDE
jgi:hypothetical protein